MDAAAHGAPPLAVGQAKARSNQVRPKQVETALIQFTRRARSARIDEPKDEVERKIPKDEVEREILRLLQHQRHDQAIAAFEQHHAMHAQLSSVTYYRLMRATNDRKLGEKTLKIAEAMQGAARHKPDRYALNQILKGMSLCGRARDAGRLLLSMPQRGIEPDVWSYTTCIAAHCNARDLASGAQFTCFTITKVHILTQLGSRGAAPTPACARHATHHRHLLVC